MELVKKLEAVARGGTAAAADVSAQEENSLNVSTVSNVSADGDRSMNRKLQPISSLLDM